jgi:muramoyltetrapeptide carboxypeptidase
VSGEAILGTGASGMAASGPTAREAYLDTAPLAPGDTVALVAASGKSDQEHITYAVELLSSWGLKVKVGEHILDGHPRASYLSAPDAGRRTDLVRAWCDPEVDAVIAARGGYGAMRLLDGIDWEAMRASAFRGDGRPKLLTGSSDVTALHEAFRVHLDVPTLFCPMVANDVVAKSEFIREDLKRWLFQPWRGREIVGPHAEVLRPGVARGRFTGGTLSLVSAAIGAPEFVVPDGCLLFLEDVDEDAYSIDNLLVQLARSGRLSAASGLVLGSWQNCAPLDEVKALFVEYLDDYLGGLDIPVLFQQGFGHDPNALSLPMNVDGVVDLTGNEPLLVVGE